MCVCIDSHLVALIIEVGSFRAWFFPLTQKHQFLGSGKGLVRVWQGFLSWSGKGPGEGLATVRQGSDEGAGEDLARDRRESGEGLAKNNGKTKVQIKLICTLVFPWFPCSVPWFLQIDLYLGFSWFSISFPQHGLPPSRLGLQRWSYAKGNSYD